MSPESDFTAWLLSADTPSIRYFTLTRLLDKPPTDPEAAAARRAIMTTGPVVEIFARQTPDGNWDKEHSFYTPKYTSTHWSMTLLTELGVDPDDERFQRGVDFMLDDTAERLGQHFDEADFSWSCLWGNILRYALHAGREDDPRLARLLDFAVNTLQRGPCGCNYNSGHACAWGTVRTMWGLAALPSDHHTPAIDAALETGVDFLLNQFSLAAADYPGPEGGKISRYWSQLSFPLFYQADRLMTLRVLAELGRLDHPGARPALDWVASRRKKNGRWRGASPFRRRIGSLEEIDRWVSLQASLLLKQAAVVPTAAS